MQRVVMCFVISLLVSSATWAEKHPFANGLFWELNNGVLTISGNGKIPDLSGEWLQEGVVKKIIIQDGVTSIGAATFWEVDEPVHHLKSVVIGNTVTSIGAMAFNNCTNLTSVIIPNSVTSIEGGAFEGCASLTSINIPSSVTSIGDAAFKTGNTNNSYFENVILSMPKWLIDKGQEEWNRCGLSVASVNTYITKEKLSTIKMTGGYASAMEIKNGSTKHYKVSKGGRYGLTDSDGKEIVPCEMEALETCGTGYLKYKINGFWGVMNYQGKIIIPTDRGYTSIGDFVSFTKRFPYTMAGYKGECDITGKQISKIKIATAQQSSTTNKNTATTSKTTTTNNSNNTGGTSTIVVEHHRDPIPVQEWRACFACGGMGTMGCHSCGGSGTKYIGDRLHRCGLCNGRGIIPCNVCFGNKGQYITVYK